MSVMDDVLAAIQRDKEKTQTGDGGWIGALVAGIIVIIVTAVFAFIAWKKGKEVSRILHEQAVQEEDAHQARIDIILSEGEEAAQKALQEAEAARVSIEALEEKRQRLEEEHREIRKKIDAITSWDDVDSFLGGNR